MFSQSSGVDICITTHFAENQRGTGRFLRLPLITQSGRRTLEPVSCPCPQWYCQAAQPVNSCPSRTVLSWDCDTVQEERGFIQCYGMDLASGLNLADRVSNLWVKEFSSKQRSSRTGREAVVDKCKTSSFLWSGPEEDGDFQLSKMLRVVKSFCCCCFTVFKLLTQNKIKEHCVISSSSLESWMKIQSSVQNSNILGRGFFPSNKKGIWKLSFPSLEQQS